MYKTKVVLEFSTQNKLTEDEEVMLHIDIAARIQGLHTQPLDFMEKSTLVILNRKEEPIISHGHRGQCFKIKREKETYERDLE